MIKETFKQAVQNVLSNKVRTFLTMLGIIIGVMAVIVIVGLGNGMTNMMQDFYSDMGSDILAVNVMTASTRTVEVSDVYNIINQKPEYYKGLSPIASAGGDTLRVAGEKYRRTGISGVNEDYTTINNYKVAKGRGIQYTDLIDNKNICVIGDYVDRKIFGGNGLGSTLKVGASEYRIVGVLEGRSKPASQYEGGNDDVVLIPYTTLMSVNNTSSVSEYYVVLQDADHSDAAQEYLQKSIKKLVSKDDYVYVMSLSAAMKQMSSMINVMVGVLTAIAGISLLVGGIGIMNIMLVSVTERTNSAKPAPPNLHLPSPRQGSLNRRFEWFSLVTFFLQKKKVTRAGARNAPSRARRRNTCSPPGQRPPRKRKKRDGLRRLFLYLISCPCGSATPAPAPARISASCFPPPACRSGCPARSTSRTQTWPR